MRSCSCMTQVGLDMLIAPDGSAYSTFNRAHGLWTSMGIEAKNLKEHQDGCIWSEGFLKFWNRINTSIYLAEVLVTSIQVCVWGGKSANAMILQLQFKEMEEEDEKAPAIFQSPINIKRGGIKMGKSPRPAPSPTTSSNTTPRPPRLYPKSSATTKENDEENNWRKKKPRTNPSNNFLSPLLSPLPSSSPGADDITSMRTNDS